MCFAVITSCSIQALSNQFFSYRRTMKEKDSTVLKPIDSSQALAIVRSGDPLTLSSLLIGSFIMVSRTSSFSKPIYRACSSLQPLFAVTLED